MLEYTPYESSYCSLDRHFISIFANHNKKGKLQLQNEPSYQYLCPKFIWEIHRNLSMRVIGVCGVRHQNREILTNILSKWSKMRYKWRKFAVLLNIIMKSNDKLINTPIEDVFFNTFCENCHQKTINHVQFWTWRTLFQPAGNCCILGYLGYHPLFEM